VTRPRKRVPGLTDPDEGARVATDGGEAPLPRLPHERDERAGRPAGRTRAMTIAARDVEEGRVDTDCRSSAPAPECGRDVAALLKPPPARPRKDTSL